MEMGRKKSENRSLTPRSPPSPYNLEHESKAVFFLWRVSAYFQRSFNIF